jgi:GxxExxY protein
MAEKAQLIWKDESYTFIGACFAVERIPFLSKPPQTLQYRGRTFVQTFMPDFVCYDKILVEIKAVSALVDEHRAQLLNYLSATGCDLGLLVNFSH